MPGEDPTVTKLRVQAMYWTCQMGNLDCIKTAADAFYQWMADPTNTS